MIFQGLWHPLRLRQDEALGAPIRLLSPEAAFVTLRMLEDDEHVLPVRGASLPLRLKTGTSNGFRDAWTAGTVGQYILVVWVGNFDGSSNPLFIGAKAAQPLFMETARALASLRSLHDPLPEQRHGLDLAEIPVCTSTGDVDTSRCSETTSTLFLPGISPIRDSGILRPILIDKASGLRACEAVPGETEEIFWEFWPSDLRRIFAQAGITKPLPPDWMPLCADRQATAHNPGKAPRILFPKKNMMYYRSMGGSVRQIPLSAEADSGVEILHWFAGTAYLGSSIPKGDPYLFYLWGHAYEFNNDNNWDLLERFCQTVGNREDVWYATNIEIFDYIRDYNRLIFSFDGSWVHNPTAQEIFFSVGERAGTYDYAVKPGETVFIDRTLPEKKG